MYFCNSKVAGLGKIFVQYCKLHPLVEQGRVVYMYVFNLLSGFVSQSVYFQLN